MIRGKYKGSIEHLKEKTALLQLRPGGFVAQFDDIKLPEMLGFGWRYFDFKDFEIIIEGYFYA